MKYFLLALLVLMINGCDFKEVEEGKAAPKSAMKCGAGKCGASMIEEGSALDDKKANILSQMDEGDSRADCVINAKTTKDAYDCVRSKDGKTLTTKCGVDASKNQPAMKCGAGKCGPAMKCGAGKCGAGKCGDDMKAPAMKCGAGKCGAEKIPTH
jgi:uncharacterized low-complexity protein